MEGEEVQQAASTAHRRRNSRIKPAGMEDRSFFQRGDHLSLEQTQEKYVPPWTEPYIIGVAGPSGSGKTSVASKIIQEINTPWTVLLSLDNFYKPLTEEQKQLAHQCQFDFDTPDAVDLDLCFECVRSLKNGHKTEIPIYSFETHSRTDETFTIYGANVIVVEGLYALFSEKLRSLMHLKVYVDTDLDVCFARRLNRDILYRGRDVAGCIQQWADFVKPNSEIFIKPTMKQANVIVPKGSENVIGIATLIQHVKKQLVLKSQAHLSHLEQLGSKSGLRLAGQNHRLVQLDRNSQFNIIMTTLLSKETSRDDFIFSFNRIATILINKAIEISAQYEPVEITTPTGAKLQSLRMSGEIIAVNLIRSGDCFMTSLRQTFPEIIIGKLLIQSDSTTGEPQLHSELLPKSISNSNVKVLLFDAQVISGAALIMSIQVLLDHGVRPENITVVTYLATEVGLSRILNAFKQVKIVVGDVGLEQNLSTQVWFRQRFIDSLYFGTG